MFSGKTSGLIAEVQMFLAADNDLNTIRVYKPSLDNRYDPVDIKTHDGHSLQELTGISVSPVPCNFQFGDDVAFVGIDEAQFFDMSILDHVERMIRKGTTVVVAGLDLDSDGKPFGPMPQLLALATHVEKHMANCSLCESSANRTFRKQKQGGQILVGGTETYEPRCFGHWIEGMGY
jgi:thymidine kinase